MRILTVRQPWAWAIIHAGKDIENRSTNIAGDYRGPIAIHAAKRCTVDEVRAAIVEFPPVSDDVKSRLQRNRLFGGDPLHVGAIIGVVDLVDVHPCHGSATEPIGGCSPWADYSAMHHLVLENPRALATPIPYTGARDPDPLHGRVGHADPA